MRGGGGGWRGVLTLGWVGGVLTAEDRIYFSTSMLWCWNSANSRRQKVLPGIWFESGPYRDVEHAITKRKGTVVNLATRFNFTSELKKGKVFVGCSPPNRPGHLEMKGKRAK